MKVWIRIATGLIIFCSQVSFVSAAESSAVPYPDGYRAWTHVKSMVIGAGHPLFASFGGITSVRQQGGHDWLPERKICGRRRDRIRSAGGE